MSTERSAEYPVVEESEPSCALPKVMGKDTSDGVRGQSSHVIEVHLACRTLPLLFELVWD